LKSAQFPLHGWLIEVMETPTPVSALLHAGIINAGGFLVLRFSHVIAPSRRRSRRSVIGGFTALFGSVVMLTQTSIKVVAGVLDHRADGLHDARMRTRRLPRRAAAHRRAFALQGARLSSSGSVIDIARASWTPSPGGKPASGAP
jgi:NAD(P)H-quinone oxidoreductase subunit 5